MTLHHRSALFRTYIILTAVLFATPISAAPSDYIFDVQEIGPHHSHITVRLRNVNPAGNGGQPVSDATVMIGAHVSPETEAAETMVEQFLARPGPGAGRFTIIVEPGLTVYQLSIIADVPGEVPGSVTATIPIPP
jgi:hypothetical protein